MGLPPATMLRQGQNVCDFHLKCSHGRWQLDCHICQREMEQLVIETVEEAAMMVDQGNIASGPEKIGYVEKPNTPGNVTELGWSVVTTKNDAGRVAPVALKGAVMLSYRSSCDEERLVFQLEQHLPKGREVL